MSVRDRTSGPSSRAAWSSPQHRVKDATPPFRSASLLTPIPSHDASDLIAAPGSEHALQSALTAEARSYLNARSLHQLLTDRARLSGTMPFIFTTPPRTVAAAAPPPLTCEQLLDLVIAVNRQLNEWGIGAEDRLASFLPAGPESTVFMLAAGCSAIYTPLNPRDAQPELEQSLTILRVQAVVVMAGDSPGRAAAIKLGVPLIELTPCLDGPAGAFTLNRQDPWPIRRGASWRGGFTQPGDLFLVLQTSGTTRRPKCVPLTHQSILLAQSHNWRSGFGAGERGLHVLSTSHIMGVAQVLASLMAGSELAVGRGFLAQEFMTLVREFEPSWFILPPAIHRSLLQYVGDHKNHLARRPIRMLRSAAAALPTALREEMERAWQAPVYEAYGMSECPLISSNYPADGWNRPGSVGRACGAELGFLDESGVVRPADAGDREGELVIRSAQLMQGYEEDAQANADSQALDRDGRPWFRTGDLARLDSDGFLFITGRNKEMINRGGQKIAPRDVDEAILTHPAVADAVCFSIPDEKLGEEIAVAAVLRPGMAATELQLREHAAAQLSAYKVPRRVVFLDQIPVGRTGKAQRIGLAKTLGLDQTTAGNTTAPKASQDPRTSSLKPVFVSPRTPLEQALAAIWGQVLGKREPIGVDENFMELGGDSLQAVAMFAEIKALLGRELPVSALLAAPTVAGLAKAMSDAGWQTPDVFAVPIQPVGTMTPLFCVPGMYGNVFTFYPLARALGDDQPVFGLQLPRGASEADVPPRNVRDVARTLVEHVRRTQPTGPYRLSGYSYGGYVAYEMACQLREAGQDVSVTLFDTRGPGYPRRGRLATRLVRKLRAFTVKPPAAGDGRATPRGKSQEQFAEPEGPAHIRRASIDAILAYQPPAFDGLLLLVRAEKHPKWMSELDPDETMGWHRLAQNVTVTMLPGDHVTLLTAPNVNAVAEALRRA